MLTPNKTASSNEEPTDLQSVINDIASLKHDIAILAGNLKNSALNATSDAARSAADQVSGEAVHLYENLAARGDRSAKAISHQVEENPLMSLLLAFGLGFLGSRLLSR